jgi:protein SCO1/2
MRHGIVPKSKTNAREFRWPSVAMLFILGLAITLVTGCNSRSAPKQVAEKQYPVRGMVMSTDTGTGEVLLNHEAIPGLMEAMTMSYKLDDPGIMSELHAGDRITATLTVQGAGKRQKMSLDHIVIIAQANPDTRPKVLYHVPTPGDVVPDFPLLNQSGHLVHIGKFRGKVVLLTFIYTRCQMADFCPRMSRNFAEIDKALATDPNVYAQTHLLSISFDPAYDTPTVLRSYGGAYTGNYTREKFTHWDFAAPSPGDLPKMEQFFDLGLTGEGASLMHSLATVIVGKDGKVVAYYPTNDWTPETLLAQIRAAAAA